MFYISYFIFLYILYTQGGQKYSCYDNSIILKRKKYMLTFNFIPKAHRAEKKLNHQIIFNYIRL